MLGPVQGAPRCCVVPAPRPALTGARTDTLPPQDPKAFNLFLWGLFYIPIFIFYLSAVAIVAYAFYRLTHGLRATCVP